MVETLRANICLKLPQIPPAVTVMLMFPGFAAPPPNASVWLEIVAVLESSNRLREGLEYEILPSCVANCAALGGFWLLIRAAVSETAGYRPADRRA